MCIKGRATPWENGIHKQRPERAKVITQTYMFLLLPFQGVLFIHLIPRALP